MRVEAVTGPLFLSFDTEEERDRAAVRAARRDGSRARWQPPDGHLKGSDMDAWEYTDIVADASAPAARATTSSCGSRTCRRGIYVLEAGAIDLQSPHTEDELYYVVAGRGLVTVGGETRPVVPGSVIFVARHRPASLPRHRRAARAPRDLRSGRGRSRLTADGASEPCRAVSRPGPGDRVGQRQGKLGPASDLVVPEENVDVVAGGQERLDARGPGVSSASV